MARTKARASSRTAQRVLNLWGAGEDIETISRIAGLTPSSVVKFLKRSGIRNTEERR